MRLPLALSCLLAFALANGQSQTRQSLFMTTRFDAAIVVSPAKKEDMQDVQVTVLKATYSPQLLQEQIVRLGRELNFEPRGVQIFTYSFDDSDPTARQLKASFGIAGLVEPDGVLRIQPLARAFALESGRDRLDGLMVQFQNQVPTDNTLRACSPPAPGCEGVEVEARAQDRTYGVEYRVKLLTHDPAKISTPDRKSLAPVASPKPPEKKSADGLLIALIAFAAVAMGALVYSLLLRGRPTART